MEEEEEEEDKEEEEDGGAFGPEVDVKSRSSCIQRHQIPKLTSSYNYIYGDCLTGDPLMRYCLFSVINDPMWDTTQAQLLGIVQIPWCNL